jgi:hypothetical protein
MTVRLTRIAYWISKVINTHSEHIIVIAFPLQHWLHERTTMLRCAYMACLSLCVHVLPCFVRTCPALLCAYMACLALCVHGLPCFVRTWPALLCAYMACLALFVHGLPCFVRTCPALLCSYMDCLAFRHLLCAIFNQLRESLHAQEFRDLNIKILSLYCTQ